VDGSLAGKVVLVEHKGCKIIKKTLIEAIIHLAANRARHCAAGPCDAETRKSARQGKIPPDDGFLLIINAIVQIK
jgi:hypothetical protein